MFNTFDSVDARGMLKSKLLIISWIRGCERREVKMATLLSPLFSFGLTL